MNKKYMEHFKMQPKIQLFSSVLTWSLLAKIYNEFTSTLKLEIQVYSKSRDDWSCRLSFLLM